MANKNVVHDDYKQQLKHHYYKVKILRMFGTSLCIEIVQQDVGYSIAQADAE